MGYLKIPNLYKEQDVLMFKEVYAMEKIHGTSAHITWKNANELHFFSGGEKYEKFISLFDEDFLRSKFEELGVNNVTIYGEAYGDKQQGMRDTYGDDLKFIVFDVKIEGNWLSVPNAADIAKRFELDFVWWTKTSTDLKALDKLRDLDSQQAILNGMGPGKKSEGIVIRPLIELKKNSHNRIIAKHKRDDFRETKTKRKVQDLAKLKVLEEANAVVEEWVTLNRLKNIISHLHPDDVKIENIPMLIKKMNEDIFKEGAGEFIESKEVRKAIGKKTVQLFFKAVLEK